MEVTWLGHASFRLKGREATIITDPYPRSLGLNPGRLAGEIVTVSHDSPNHSAAASVSGHPRVVSGPGEYEIRDVMIQGVATPGERLGDDSFGRNTSFSIHVDELTVCHLGDLGRTLTAEQIEALKDPDVLLLPVGGHCTISPSSLTDVISQLEPKYVVPMHYALSGVALQLEPLDRFCRELGVADARAQPKLTVTKSSVPDEVTIVILELAATRGR